VKPLFGEQNRVCPVCKKGFHLSTPGVYQDGVGGFLCSKACIERHPVLDEDGGLRVWGVWDLSRDSFVEFTQEGWRDGITKARAEWWATRYSVNGHSYEARIQGDIEVRSLMSAKSIAATIVVLPHEANEDRHIRDDAGRYSSQGDVVVGNGKTGERDWKAESEMNRRRANLLADECQAIKDQNTELLAENARLRRARR
jgi:hypothetical protein